MAGKNSTKQKEKLFQELESCIEKMDSSLDSIKDSVNQIQVGDGNNPYWNGYNACSTVKTILTQCQMNKALLDYVKECKESIKNR